MNAHGIGLATPSLNVALPIEARPTRAPTVAARLRFERFELDEQNARLLCDGRAVDLAPKPFDVLCALARRPGTLLLKNALLDEVWGHRFVTESVLKTVIAKLRTALGDDARNPRFIETVPRRGYRFIGTQGSASTAAPAAPDMLLEICEMLLAMIEQPQGRHGAVTQLKDYLARLTGPQPIDHLSLTTSGQGGQ